MKLSFSIAFILLLSLRGVAQMPNGNNGNNNNTPNNGHNSNSLSVIQNQPVSFYYNSIDELLNGKTISNAIELQVDPDRNAYNIYCSISFSNPGSGLENKLSIKLASKTSPNSIDHVPAQLTLSSAPQLLLSQPQLHSNSPYYSFFYDIGVAPISTFLTPGTYNFNLLFTISQP